MHRGWRGESAETEEGGPSLAGLAGCLGRAVSQSSGGKDSVLIARAPGLRLPAARSASCQTPCHSARSQTSASHRKLNPRTLHRNHNLV